MTRARLVLLPATKLVSLSAASAAWACAGALIAAASLVAAPDVHGMLGAALGLAMFGIARSDAGRFVVPDILTAPAFALGLLDGALEDGFSGLGAALISAALAAGAFFVVRIAYKMYRGREGLGLGDVKLAAVAGAWLGFLGAPWAIEFAALFAIAAYLVRQLRKGRALRAMARLPLGAFLAPAIWLVWLVEAWFSLS